MDPNLPQTPNPKRNITVIIFITIIIIILIAVALIYSPNLFKKEPPQPLQTKAPTPTSTASAQIQQALSKIRTVQGKVTAVKNDSISVNIGSVTETFSITNLVEVGEVLDPADGTKTKKVEKTALKVGQTVQIITNVASSSARIILILK